MGGIESGSLGSGRVRVEAGVAILGVDTHVSLGKIPTFPCCVRSCLMSWQLDAYFCGERRPIKAFLDTRSKEEKKESGHRLSTFHRRSIVDQSHAEMR